MKRVSSPAFQSCCVQPTFLIGTTNEDGSPNFAPITWIAATHDTDHYLLVVSLFGTKRTRRNVERTGMLSANLVSADMLPMLDYYGSCSGNNGTKDAFADEVEQGLVLPVPTLRPSRWVYECEAERSVVTGDTGTYFCAMRNVQVMEELQHAKELDLTVLDPIVYAGDYHTIGRHLGKIGDFWPPKAE